jgi:hypothetical protein
MHACSWGNLFGAVCVLRSKNVCGSEEEKEEKNQGGSSAFIASVEEAEEEKSGS